MMRARAEAITRLCFDAEPAEDDLELLGARERWLLYRSMVRSRLVKVVRTAVPRTREALGDDALGARIDAWLAEAPPRTRYFWQVPLAFGAFAEGRLPETPAYLDDLLRYELARWRANHAEAPPAPAVVDFAFDRAPALAPSLTLHVFSHPVHLDAPKLEAAQRTQVAIFRDRAHRAGALALNPTAGALVEAWLGGEETMAESVRAVAQARGLTVDQSFIDKLGALLADFLERGLLLGSKA
jgi:hypothetical protein